MGSNSTSKATPKKLVLTVAALTLAAILTLSGLAGCSGSQAQTKGGEKTFTYGTVAYSESNSDAGLDPHNSYMGWSAVRYGIGETLFKFTDAMEIEPWLAKGYEFVDSTTVKVELRDDVTFSNGKKVDGAAVKACIEDLVARHDRAPGDLKIASIEASGQTVTIRTTEPNPAVMHYLSDPYGAIIDVAAGVTSDFNVVGTGPYVATSVSPTEIHLKKNGAYWGGTVNVDNVVVKSITDGDTLTMSLQAGEIDAAQGLPYTNLALFGDASKYTVSSTNTSRVYQAAFNFKRAAMQDAAVRKAIAMSLNSEDFVNTLLSGHGSPATGPFPQTFEFAVDKDAAVAYDPEGAKQLLASAGWVDTNGDGYVDKNGSPLEIVWLTYTSRQELPKLAEYAQAVLKDVGIKVKVNATDSWKNYITSGDYDIFANAFVTAPQGDPQYYITTHLLDSSSYNRGFYHNDTVERLTSQLRTTFDTKQRAQLAEQIQAEVLKDNGYYYASFLEMSLVMKSNVTGLVAHPSDYYEITANLNMK